METPVVTSNMITDILQKITLSSSSSDLQISSLKLFQIGDQCQEHNVNLYIDAEYSHLQPAVRLLTLCLMKKYNKIGGQGTFVYNTYQCYLKDSISHLSHDIELAKSIHIPLACKLVRGAYLKIESERFNLGEIEEYPIHRCYNETNDSYNQAVRLCLEAVVSDNLRVTVATHNLKSAELALSQVQSNPILKSGVNFAQINGLGDHISMALSLQGCQVLKLLPCGTVDEVLPWLSRRLQENNVATDRVSMEKNLIGKELRSRIYSFIVR